MKTPQVVLLSVLSFVFLPSVSVASPASDVTVTKAAQTLPLPIEVIYEFPPKTWVENLAVQSSGNILVTLLTTPDVYQVNPIDKTATLIHSFTPYLGTLGIAELHHNVFYVVAGNFSITTLQTTLGAWAVYELDLTNGTSVTKITDFPSAILLNGVTVLSKAAGTLLIADSGAGVIYSLDTKSGQTRIVIDDPTAKPLSNSTLQLGVNGLKIRNNTLYFTNNQQATVVRVPIYEDGTPSGPATIISRDVPGADDFTIGPNGNIFVTENSQNSLVVLGPEGGNATVIAGAPLEDPTLLAGPTAVQFGRREWDRGSLYVTTTAGDASGATNDTLGGTVSRVDLRGTGLL